MLSLALALPLVCASFAGTERPPIFADLDFPAAKSASVAQKKLLVLDAMTSWCGPCKQMDATTWVDPSLVAWMRANAIAIQLDMDLHEALKKELAIGAFPTIVVFKEGVEFDRVVGLRSAAFMATWLSDILAGKKAAERLREQLVAARAKGAAAWHERFFVAEELSSSGDDPRADYLWCWNNVPAGDEHALQIKHTSLRWAMRDLAAGDPQARRAFAALRDSLGTPAPTTDVARVRDWLDLNAVVDEPRATVAWAESMGSEQDGVALLRRVGDELFDLLVSEGAWRAAGLALQAPVERVRWLGSNLGAYDIEGKPGVIPAIPLMTKPAGAPQLDAGEGRAVPAVPMVSSVPMISMGGAPTARKPETPEEIAAEVRRRLTDQLLEMASARYAALLAAERAPEAREVAAALVEYVAPQRGRAALLATCLRAGVIERERESHQEWLEAIARNEVSLPKEKAR